ncbi:RNA polymerase-associated protein-like protein [Emericellopsis cladophorae]|uniref:RNA polymerase-associated protein-like protein n=1 Tax=Emericellopsis cladophorae TaxID=2686198 RepID=A0A9Q0BIF2_9HYPO|nr:RNA polymerase-associated protein-like protein [Emericellopsis cladophorae]KAI6785840.1 RNA polymerase-associated protein-like protein [Emericellopsis cladophorae]
MSDSDEPIDPIDEGGDDLFGDDSDAGDAAPSPAKQQVLNDDDLASDPDEDARPRQRGYSPEQGQEMRDAIVLDVTTYRHPIPKPSDGILRTMKVPEFISFQPEQYNSETFEPTEADIANAKSERPQYDVRFRRDEASGKLVSNTNILRWSDGSVTISVGGEQYEIYRKPLAPAPGQPYNAKQDAHHYAAAAELSSNLLMTVGHITEQYSVRPNKSIGDEAMALLTKRLAAEKGGTAADMIIRQTEDPELAKRKAEQLEKERNKALRKQENANAKQEFGLGRSGRGGLSIGALEGAGGGRKRGAPGAKPKRRRPEYDSDDDLPQGVGRQEKYDLEDGFLVDSDEEEEGYDDGDDILDDVEEKPRKRHRTEEASEAEEDASGDEIEPAPEAASRSRRRNVVDSDDE